MRLTKYICAVIGGAIGLTLSISIFGYLTRLTTDFSQVNFAVIPFVFIVADLILYAVHSWRWTKKQPKIRNLCVSSVAHACVGAVWGLIFGYFTQLDLFWCITGFTIVYAIPYTSIISAFVSVPLFWWMCWDKYSIEHRYWNQAWWLWETEKIWTIPPSMEWIRAPLFVHLLVIPFFALLGYKIGTELPSLRREIILRREHEKWVGAITGGLICLIWSLLPFLSIVFKFYTGINFLILPFFIFGAWFLSLSYYYYDYDKEDPLRFTKLVFCAVINALAGALCGLIISGFFNVDASLLPWIMIVCAVIAAIPYLGGLFIFGGIALQIIFVILNWQILLTCTPSAHDIASYPYLILALPSLLAIPASIIIGYEAGGFVGDKLKKARLKLIEGQIKNLEEIIKKHETVLTQRKQMERNIDRIVAIDPSNFRLKADLFRKQAKELDTDSIRRRIIEMNGEIQKWDQLRKQAEEKLYSLESEKESLERRLKEIRNRLQMLEVVDPANIKIKMQKLQTEWEGVKREELEKIEVAGELEALFKEQLLLSFQIKEKSGEIEDQRKEVAHLNLTVDALQLEKHVLEIEIIDRKIESEEPRILELGDKLIDLQAKRDRIKQSLKHQEQS